jgi:thiamine-phosphate pyrophosphorylase
VKARFPRGLYALTPDEPDTGVLLAKVRLALAGGAVAVQYRNKPAAAALRRRQATGLAGLCAAAGVPLIVNDDVALALEVGAAGAHLGREDGDLASARARLGPERLLGASCYDRLDLALAAVAAGADHVAFGAFFASPTKPAAVRAPLALLAEARRRLAVPVVAIGGITLANAGEAVRAGADALAVITALFEADDIAARARAFQQLFTRMEAA